jgi:DNA-binding MarR family transcriptional regulator
MAGSEREPMEQEEVLNHFLVKVFHEVLRKEDAAIAEGGFANLSSREMHVIEAVCRAEDSGEGDNSSASVARRLGITAGTLSASVKVLERKGYLIRRRDQRDKRIVRLCSTEEGRRADAFHDSFHREMVRTVLEVLSPEEAAIFGKALGAVAGFFQGEEPSKKEDL